MIYNWNGNVPSIDETAFITDGVHIIGNVTIGPLCSIWYGAVLRGDDNYIQLGKGSNVQDNCVVHAGKENKPVIIGDNVTIGHGAIIHGSTIGDNVLVGMGVIILDGASIGSNTILAAGSLVPPGKKIPEGVLCMGSPARVVRNLTEDDLINIKASSEHYINLCKRK